MYTYFLLIWFFSFYSIVFFSLKVINDWQTWSETQNAEVEQMKVSLEQYTQAYNEAVAQVEQLKGQGGGGDTQGDTEVEKLKAAVKTKDIEIEELSETLDRSVLYFYF